MFTKFEEVVERAKKLGPFTVSVAVAQDLAVLKAIKMAEEMGLIKPILVGDEDKIKPMLGEVGLDKDTPILHEADDALAVEKAVSVVREGKASVLMKGFVNTSIFMRGILNRNKGLRTGRLISLLAGYEIPGHNKIVFCSDSGVNVAPNLDQKKDILANSLFALRSMGFEMPKVAALAANEMVDPKISATVDAKALVEMNERGELPSCIIEGPIAMDVACDAEAAKHKGIDSKVSGDVDLFFVPYIEVGNVLGKSWIHFNKAKWAGIVLGATNPVVLGSRSDTAEIKLNSIALACLASNKKD